MGVAFRYLAVSAALCLLPSSATAIEHALAWYCILSLGVLGGLIHFNFGPAGRIMLKDAHTGQVHPVSYLVHLPFHIVNLVIIRLTHSAPLLFKKRTAGSEVSPGIWLAGKNSAQVEQLAGNFTAWDCVVDLTCEFSETARVHEANYLNVPTWDGCPPTVEQIEYCANFCKARYRADGRSLLLVHCAHGVGRSTLVMCAVLVKLGLHPDGQTALRQIKLARPVARLNVKMTQRLAEWEHKYT